jgi:hypothetical protein
MVCGTTIRCREEDGRRRETGGREDRGLGSTCTLRPALAVATSSPKPPPAALPPVTAAAAAATSSSSSTAAAAALMAAASCRAAADRAEARGVLMDRAGESGRSRPSLNRGPGSWF